MLVRIIVTNLLTTSDANKENILYEGCIVQCRTDISSMWLDLCSFLTGTLHTLNIAHCILDNIAFGPFVYPAVLTTSETTNVESHH